MTTMTEIRLARALRGMRIATKQYEDDCDLDKAKAAADAALNEYAATAPPTTTEPEDSITVHLPLTDSFCADVLCAALEGGIGYWACAEAINRTEDAERDYVSATLVDAEDDDNWRYVVDYAAIRRGIRRLLSPGFNVSNAIMLATMQAVREDDAGYIDADCADCIVQAACFHELVYG